MITPQRLTAMVVPVLPDSGRIWYDGTCELHHQMITHAIVAWLRFGTR